MPYVEGKGWVWERKHWQNADAATAPAGAIILSIDMPKQFVAQQRTDNKGVEGWGRFKVVEPGRLLELGYREIPPVPEYGFTVRSPEGTTWRVGGLLANGERKIWKPEMPAGLPSSMPLNDLIEWEVVETHEARLEREGEERGAKLEQRAKALEEQRRLAAKNMKTPAQMKQESLL